MVGPFRQPFCSMIILSTARILPTQTLPMNRNEIDRYETSISRINLTYFRVIFFERQTIFPVIPAPTKLKVTQMIREPSNEAIETRSIHGINPFIK